MKIIDSHQHFWDPSRGDYHWMPKDNPILNRKYEVKDLSQVSESIDLHKTILVQAAATNAETEYMLNIAENSDLVCGVVGWVNFEDKNQLEQLKIFSKHPKFLGVSHNGTLIWVLSAENTPVSTCIIVLSDLTKSSPTTNILNFLLAIVSPSLTDTINS